MSILKRLIVRGRGDGRAEAHSDKVKIFLSLDVVVLQVCVDECNIDSIVEL
jgi:hypothetical protein